MSSKKSAIVPRLRDGRDAEHALKLGALVRDARATTRKFVILGLYLDAIAAQLTHGRLGPWIDAHQEEIGASRTTIFDWRDFSGEVLKAAKLEKSGCRTFALPLHEALALPAGEVPAAMQPVCAKIDAVISGKNMRQVRLSLRAPDDYTPGGVYHPPKKLTPEEEHALFLAGARAEFEGAFTRLDQLVRSGHWKAPCIKDGELDDAITVAQVFVKEAKAWLKTPKKLRTRVDANEEEAE